MTQEGTINGHTFGVGSHVTTFCTELTQTVSPGYPYEYNFTNVSSMPTTGQPASPMGTYRAGLAYELYRNHFFDAVSGDLDNAAAMQLALWEIVYEGNLGVAGGIANLADVDGDNDGTLGTDDTRGEFYITSGGSDAVVLANSWLDALTGIYTDADNTLLIGFGSSSNQDQVTLIPLPPPAPARRGGFRGRRHRAPQAD